MRRSRSVRIRVLHLYDRDSHGSDAALACLQDATLDTLVHVRSRFRSLVDASRFALYSMHDGGGTTSPPGLAEHRLMAVREFRRVPLDASSLALTVFTARPGRAVTVVATLAGFVARAVDLYQPGYLLLAHSLEEPRTSMLLTAVRDAAALGAAASSGFSLDSLRPELDPLLAGPPECYAYDPEPQTASLIGAV
jgi:hypothetical protein